MCFEVTSGSQAGKSNKDGSDVWESEDEDSLQASPYIRGYYSDSEVRRFKNGVAEM